MMMMTMTQLPVQARIPSRIVPGVTSSLIVRNHLVLFPWVIYPSLTTEDGTEVAQKVDPLQRVIREADRRVRREVDQLVLTLVQHVSRTQSKCSRLNIITNGVVSYPEFKAYAF